ncbi:MAG: CDP-alcohol phosphatidyltransferase family protein [Saprospiraceae bacterium]
MTWLAEYRNSLKLTEVEDIFDLFFYRPIAFILVKLIYPYNITPNQLTYTALVFGLISGIMYAQGWSAGFIWGSLFFVLYNIFDCADGQLSRLKKNGTSAGRIIDGIADYLATLTVFIGIGFGFANHQSNPGYWWFLILLLIVSSLVQAILVDYYRNRFMDYVLKRKSTFVEELDSYRTELNQLEPQKDKWVDKTIIKIYLAYCDFQKKIIKDQKQQKPFFVTPEAYYKKNKLPMRIWIFICSSSEITILVICSLINRLDLFFIIVLIGFNGLALFMWFIQQSIDRTFKVSHI